MYQEFIEKFKNSVSLDGVTYYYHVTDINPKRILEEGLFMMDDKIYKTAIQIPKEFIDDPITYCEGEKGNFYRKNPSIVIIGIDNDNIDDLVREIEYYPSEWMNDEMPNFYISPKYILGYINTNDYEYVLNGEYDLADELYLKLIK